MLFPGELCELERDHAREEQADADAQLAAQAANVVAREAAEARAASSLLTPAEEWAARRARRAAAQGTARALAGSSSAAHAAEEWGEAADLPPAQWGEQYAAEQARLFRIAPAMAPAAGGELEEGEPPAHVQATVAAEHGALDLRSTGFFTANEVWRMQQSNPSATPSRIYTLARRTAEAATAAADLPGSPVSMGLLDSRPLARSHAVPSTASPAWVGGGREMPEQTRGSADGGGDV